MAVKTIKELMIPVSEYATVHKDATLYEAVAALEKAQSEFDKNRYHHRAILVLDEKDNVVGKLGQLAMLRALEPKYEHIELGRFGYSRKYMEALMDKFNLWEEPLDHICKKAFGNKVHHFMDKPAESELIDENASLSAAIHQLVMGWHQSLLVTEAGKIIGILRLTDVFHEVSLMMKACNP
jgi:predicted transcriptional regulator